MLTTYFTVSHMQSWLTMSVFLKKQLKHSAFIPNICLMLAAVKLTAALV